MLPMRQRTWRADQSGLEGSGPSSPHGAPVPKSTQPSLAAQPSCSELPPPGAAPSGAAGPWRLTQDAHKQVSRG